MSSSLRGHGTLIHFEDNVISSNGRKVPLEDDNTPHNCPFGTYNQKKIVLQI
jgi:hypothetical protein